MTRKTGIAIIVALLALAAIIVLGFAVISLGVQNLNHAESHLYGKKALLAAEAGIAQSLRRLHADRTWHGAGLPGRLTSGPETYAVQVTNNMSGTTPLSAPNGALVPAGTTYLLATGTAGEGQVSRSVGVLVGSDAQSSVWRYAMFGYTFVDLGNGHVDSFNSQVGPYSQSRNPLGGAIGTDNPDPPPDAISLTFPAQGILVGPQGSVNHVDIGPSGTPSQIAPGVSPDVVQNMQASLARDLELVEPPFAAGQGTQNFKADGPLAPGAYGAVSVTGKTTLTLSPGNYVFQTLDVGGSATLRVDAGIVKIYVVGDGGQGDDLVLRGGSLTNTTMIPGNLLIFVGPAASEVKIAGGPNVAAGIMAPLSDVVLDGSAGAFYGSIIGHSVTGKGQPWVHYDEAMGGGGGEAGTVKVLSWQRY